MPTGDLIRALLFVGGVAGVYLLAGWFLLCAILKRGCLSARRLWLRGAVFSLAIVGMLCVAYGYLVEPYRLEVTRVQIVSRKLKPGTRLRIVQISDLHSSDHERLEPQIPRLIARQKPDLIVYTGDTSNSPAGLARAQRMFQRLAAIAPVYSVAGNWDDPGLLDGTGVQELDSRVVALQVNGNAIRIAGVAATESDGKPPLMSLLWPVPADKFLIVLFHRPHMIENVARLHNADLYCAGHTHGGQVALPFYGAIITLTPTGKKYEAGLYKVQDTYLYVNRGIGMEANALPVRFCARPEITVFDVFGGTPQP